MKSKFLIVTLVLLALCTKIFSQTIIDYQTINPTNCNIFSPTINVNSIPHKTVLGQPTYNTTNKSVILKCDYTSNFNKGTQYKLLYPFKQGYTYKITINAKNMTTAAFGNVYGQIGLYMDNDNSLTNGNNSCNGPEVVSLTGSVRTINPDFFVDYDFNFSSMSSNYSTFYVYSTPVPGCTPIIQNIEIKKITITETPPTPTFTITPSSLTVGCGSTTAQTFTVNNVYNSPGTLSYNWNLGAANNGWLYNGSAAPQTFSTTSNSIVLTPSGTVGITLSNVGVVPVLNNAAQPALTCAVTVSNTSNLPLSINQPSPVCGGGLFSVSGLPAGSSVVWSASPPSSVSITPSGNNATISNSLNPGGYVNITAAVTLSNGCQQQVTASGVYFGTYPTTATYTTGSSQATTANSLNYVPPVQTIALTVNNIGAPNGSSYTFQKVYGNSNIFVNGKTVSFSLGNYSQTYPANGTITLNVTAITTCGAVTSSYSFTTQGQCGGCFGASSSYDVSPNPATNSVKITAIQPAPADAKTRVPINAIYKINIVDMYGTVIKTFNYGSGVAQATLNVSYIRTGIYTLMISDGKTKYEQQLVITK